MVRLAACLLAPALAVAGVSLSPRPVMAAGTPAPAVDPVTTVTNLASPAVKVLTDTASPLLAPNSSPPPGGGSGPAPAPARATPSAGSPARQVALQAAPLPARAARTTTTAAAPVAAATCTGCPIPTGVLAPDGLHFTAEAQAGLSLAHISIAWINAQPIAPTAVAVTWDETYFTSVKNQIATARAAGLNPVLSLGIQYAPAWVFTLPGANFVDQYGDSWAPDVSTGEDSPNGIFSSDVRAAISTYVQKVFAELGTDFAAVRWGGGLPYDEIRYPGCPTVPVGRTNCYWAYDVNAQKSMAAAGIQKYVPGTGDSTQAQAFLNFYLTSIRDYITWGLNELRKSYSGKIDLLLPSWGIRPGDISAAVNRNLDGSTPRAGEVAAGLDWQSQIPAYAAPANGAVIAWSTWLNRRDDGNTDTDRGPGHYISSLVSSLAPSMGLGGENTAGKSAFTDVVDLFFNARNYGYSRVLWFNEMATLLPGNATFQQLGQAASRHEPIADLDGDGTTDPTVYRPSTGEWFATFGSAAPYRDIRWGVATDIPVPADYDGAGRSQITVYRPSTGQWFVLHAGGGYTITTWGRTGDIPVPADYDGIGSAQLTVYRPSTGQWFVLHANGGYTITTWGQSGDVPVPADYDGAGRPQIAVYRPSTGQWFVLHANGGYTITTWGQSGDVPVPADYDGIGSAQLTVYRPGTGQWFILHPAGASPAYSATTWGSPGDIPQPGDYNAYGQGDLTVYRPGAPGVWYVLPGGGGPYQAVGWGASGDIPVVLPAAIRQAFF